MEHNIKVSVITVVYNGAQFIEGTIQSVLGQTYPNIEYIIIDGNSTDGTLAIVNKYKNQVAKIISEPDNGIYDAMNKGLRLATGQLTGIINADDWYEKDAITTVVDNYLANPDGDIYHGLLRFWSNDKPDSITGNEATFLNSGMIEHPTCFVKKTLYEKIGYFDQQYRYVADYDLMLRARLNGAKFFFIPQVLANFRRGGASTSFIAAKETLTIRYRYHFISLAKRYLLTFYWWLKCLK